MNLKSLFKSKSKKNLILKDVDIDNLTDISKILRQIDVNNVFDIGACKGRFTLSASKYFPSARFHCFEPFPDVFIELETNLRNTNAVLNQVALSKSKQEKAVFYVNTQHETNSLLASNKTNSHIDKLIENQKRIEVKVDSIDSYCTENRISKIDLLKIDAQGNSLEILEGANGMLSSFAIQSILCEVEFIEIYQNQSLFHHVMLFLESRNYSLYNINNLHYDINQRLSWADAIFLPKYLINYDK